MNLQFQPNDLYQIFDSLVDTPICIKDSDGKYVYANEAYCEHTLMENISEIIGCRAEDIYPGHMAKTYNDQDAIVFQSQEPLRDQLELIPEEHGKFVGWFLNTYFPIFDDSGEVIGITSVSHNLLTPSDTELELSKLKSLLEYIQHNLDQPMKTEDLANRIGLSAAQLDRRIKRTFRLTTKKFIIKCRLDLSMKLLVNTQHSLSEIALMCGFSEQSAFSRQFVASTKQTPSTFRKINQDPKDA